MSSDLQESLRRLEDFSACDVSDALLKIQKPTSGQVARAGYLADITTSPNFGSVVDKPKVIAPASTLKLVQKNSHFTPLSPSDPGAIPKGSHWVDLVDEGTIVVIDQPGGETCAAVGGIMAIRMKLRGARGCVVGGRVRDLAELERSKLPVWALGKSTVSTAAEATVFGRNVPVCVCGVNVTPGDIIFCDPLEGVVVIPKHQLGQVLSLLPKLVAADDRIKDDILQGSTVQEAFRKHRN